MKRRNKHFYITCLLGLICICQIYIICVLCLICGGRIFHFKSQTIPDTGSAETNEEASKSDKGNIDQEMKMTEGDFYEQWDPKKETDFLITGFLVGGDRDRKTFHLDTNEMIYITDQIMITEHTDFLIYSDPDLKSPIGCSYEEFLEDWNEDTPYEIQVEAYSEENACWTAYRVTEMSQRDWMMEKLAEGPLGYGYYHVRRTEEDGMLEIIPIEPLFGRSEEETKVRMRELYEEGRIDTPDPYEKYHYEGIYTVEYPELKQTAVITENTRFYIFESVPYPYTSRCTEEEFFGSQFYEDNIFRVIVKDGRVECIAVIGFS